jgi:NADH:ubiquinone oxidoreductase subunit 3 (subunit A)
MNSTWESYYVLFLSSIMALGIPITLVLMSYLLGFSGRREKASVPLLDSAGASIGFNQKINVRFFLAANAALILISLGIELIPCVTTIRCENPADVAKGLLAVTSLCAFASLGLTYSIRKGNMDWLTSEYMGKNKSRERG